MKSDPDPEFLISLIETIGKENNPQGEKEENICAECGSLIDYGTQKKVKVFDFNDDLLFQMHRECIEDSDYGIMDYDPEKPELNLYELGKFWKYKDKPSELSTRQPKIMEMNIVNSKEKESLYVIPRNVKPVKKDEIGEIVTKPSPEMAGKYEEGPWSEEHYEDLDSEIKERIESNELYAYYQKFHRMAIERELETGEKVLLINKELFG